MGTACPEGLEALSVLDSPDRARMPLLHGKEVDWGDLFVALFLRPNAQHPG